MKKVEQLIIDNNLIKSGEIVGVACSGGQDSMCLLNILFDLQEKLNFKLVAINIDHNLRPTSAGDSKFVKSYCKKRNIPIYAYSLDIKSLCGKNKLGLEQGAREGRYNVFNKLLDDGVVDKIALGHHMSDQAETILLNIFRGSGVAGACGMELNRDNRFIRPLLFTPKTEIRAYIEQNEIPFVEDETNYVNDYSRNYIRNMILPMIRSKWNNADASICEFGKLCAVDNKYIDDQISDSSIIKESFNTIKVYSSCFCQNVSLVSRIIMRVMKELGASVDIEKKHIGLVIDLALNGLNGAKLNLKNGVVAIKEYNFITFTNNKLSVSLKPIKLSRGKFDIPNIGVIEVYTTTKIHLQQYDNIFDANKVPAGAIWRFRQDGDVFTRFGGKEKLLNEFLIDKKIPARLRNTIPVLAVDNEIYCVAGVEISDKVRIDDNSKKAYGVNFIRF